MQTLWLMVMLAGGSAGPACDAGSAATGPETARVAAAKAPAAHIAAVIEDAAFLQGDWVAMRPGRGGEELTQEVWSGPAGNNMMGMFRWLAPNGTARVFEILTISEEEGTLVLRLRHQDALGRAWEPQDRPATLHLSRLEGRLAEFRDTTDSCDLSSCVYDCTDPDTLRITVRFDNPDRADLVFDLGRAGVAASGAGENTGGQ